MHIYALYMAYIAYIIADMWTPLSRVYAYLDAMFATQVSAVWSNVDFLANVH